MYEEMKGSTLLIGGLTPKVGGRDSSHSQMVIMTRVVEDLITISFLGHPPAQLPKAGETMVEKAGSIKTP